MIPSATSARSAPVHVRLLDERVEGLPGDERRGAPGAQGARNVPGMGGDQSHFAVGDA